MFTEVCSGKPRWVKSCFHRDQWHLLQKGLGEAGMQEGDQRTCLPRGICPLATMAATQQTQTGIAERQSNTGHTKCLLYPHLKMLMICAFTTVLTGTDSLWNKKKKRTTQNQTKQISVYFSLSPQTLHTRHYTNDWNYRTRYCNFKASWKFKDKIVYRWEK